MVQKQKNNILLVLLNLYWNQNFIAILMNNDQIKWNAKKHHTVETIPKSNIKIVEKVKINTSNTKIHDCSLLWLGTDPSIKSQNQYL
jgi:tRNA(Ile)-lysidine synthase TilS/MesJ